MVTKHQKPMHAFLNLALHKYFCAVVAMMSLLLTGSGEADLSRSDQQMTGARK